MEENSEYYCSDCGKPVKKNAIKCKNCGADITEEESELDGLEGWLFIPTYLTLSVDTPIRPRNSSGRS